MEIIINKGRNVSRHAGLNFLAKVGKVYIMDNHLAAFYCWSKSLDPMKEYALLHIDRHHDLGTGMVKAAFHQYKNIDFKSLGIEEMISLKSGEFQVLMWDNFIELYKAFNPLTISRMEFVCDQRLPNYYRHCKTEPLESWVKRELDVREEVDLLNPTEELKILDLDIDVLFRRVSEDTFEELLSEVELREFARRLKSLIDGAVVVTIALSPECCGGWDNAVSMFNRLNAYLGIECGVLDIQLGQG